MLKIWKATIVGLVLLWSGVWVLATPSGPGNINADKVILFEQRGLEPRWLYYRIDKEHDGSYTNLRKALESVGYKIAQTPHFGLALTVDYLNEYDAFVIPPQMSWYHYQHNDELSAIIQYVEGGGNLFLLGEWSTGRNVRAVARELGVEFSEWYYVIEDSEQNTGDMRCGVWDNDPLFCPCIMDIPSHPIATGVEAIYLTWSSYIEDPCAATPLIIADSPTCWARNQCGTGSCGRGDKKERPFTVLAYMEYGKGQVVFLADASVFCDSIVNRGDNLQLGLNIIDWLTRGGGPRPVDIAKAPSKLQATLTSGTQVDLSWIDNSNNESRFEIERKTEGEAYTKVASTAANVTSYLDTELELETGYCYRVRACNSFDCSSCSNEACVTTSSEEEPLPVWGCETKRTIGGYMKICTDGTLYQGEIEVTYIERIIDLNVPWPLNTFFFELVAKTGSLLQQFTDWVLPGSDVTKGFVATFSRRVDGYTKLSGTLFGLEFYSDMKIDGSGRTGVQICPKSQLCFWVWQNY